LSIAVDTNVLVRYLTWDDEAQAEKAAEIIEGDETIAISTIVLCELAWVLKRAYRYRAEQIGEVLGRIATSRNADLDRHAAEAGLRMLARGGDFAEGVVETDAARAKCRHIVTFDRDFAQLLGPEHAVLLRTSGRG
jgi:predicted nucleic-acid-binding protein